MAWPNSNPWPDELIHRLRELWVLREPGSKFYTYSASEIGVILGRKRNGVIGKAGRLRLPPRLPQNTRAARAGLQPGRARPKAKQSSPPLGRLREYVGMKPEQQLALPDALITGLMHIKDGQCRSILDQRGDDGLAVFCGAPCMTGQSFCPTHCKLYYQPPRYRGETNARGITPPAATYAASQGPAAQTTERGEGRSDRPQTNPRRANG